MLGGTNRRGPGHGGTPRRKKPKCTGPSSRGIRSKAALDKEDERGGSGRDEGDERRKGGGEGTNSVGA